MLTPRHGPATGVGADGKIFVIGGYHNGYQNVNEAYDLVADAWTTKTPLPAATEYRGNEGAVVNGTIYLEGGLSFGSARNNNFAYNTANDTWTTLAVMPTTRAHLCVVTLNGLVYAIGGTDTTGSADYSVMEVYNPSSNSWSTSTPMPTGRRGFAAAVVGGKIYAMGGSKQNGTQLTTLEVYDPTTNAWSAKAPMPTARNGLVAAVLNGFIYAIGGNNGPSFLSTVEVYDPGLDVWTTVTSLPQPLGYLNAATANESIYVFGGYEGDDNAITYSFTPTPPTLAIDDITLNEGNSGTSNFVFTVTRTGSTALSSAVDFQTQDGSARAADGDYVANSGTLTFAANETMKTIAVSVNGDTTYEMDEMFNVHLSNAVNATITDADGAGTIVNDDCFEPSANMVAWYPADGNFNDIQGPTFENGTPTGNTTFAAGKVGQAFSFDGNGDYVSVPGIFGGGPEITVDAWVKTEAVSNESPLPIQAIVSSTTENEFMHFQLSDNSNFNVVVYCDNGGVSFPIPPESPIGVWRHIAITVKSGDSHIYVNGVQTSSSTSTFSTIRPTSNLRIGSGYSGVRFFHGEIDEVEIYNRALTQTEIQSIYNAGAIGKCKHGLIGASALSYHVGEGDGSATITIQRTEGSAGAVSIHYATSDSSATAGSDYTAVSGDLNWADGDTADKTFSIPIADDGVFDPNEVVDIFLTNPTGGAQLGPNDGPVLFIDDNDPAPSFSIDDVEHNEGNSGTTSYVFTVTKSGSTQQNSFVSFATQDGTAALADNDYQSNSNTLVFTTNETAKTITVQVTGDTKFENDEAFIVHLSGASNATISDADGTGTITNDDAAPTFSIDDVTMNEGDAGTTNFVFTVTKNGDTELPSSVDYHTMDGTATAPSDYTAIPNTTLVFGPTETSKTITVQVKGDTVFELDETFTMVLGNPTGRPGGPKPILVPSGGVGTIQNDDAPPSLSINDVTMNEGNSGQTSFVFTVTKTGSTELPATVEYATQDGTATAPSDYTAIPTTTLTFQPNDATRTVTVSVNGDTTPELDEIFFVNLSNPTDATISGGQATGAILNDDCTPPPANMVSWWTGDGHADDIYGGNSGTWGGTAAYGIGEVGQAFSFDGSNSVSVAHAANLMPTALTVDVWVYPTTAGPGFTRILEKGGYNGIGGGTGYDLLFNVGSQRAQFEVWNGPNHQDVASTSSIPLNTWTHIAATFDGSTMQIYVNGVSEGSLGGVTMTPNTLPLTFGRASRGQFDFFTGQIDEIEIFDTALSPSDIANIYNAGSVGKCHTSTLQFSSATYSVNENGNNAIITVMRTGAHDTTATIDYATLSGGTATGGATCTSGTDYQTTSGTLNFAANETSKTFNVPICDDVIYEGNETVNLQLSNVTGSGASLGSSSSAVLTITENDAQPSISIDDVTLTEADGNAVFTVTQSAVSGLDATFVYSTTDGTAIAPGDYTTATNVASSIPAGSTTTTISIPTTNDSVYEADETFTVTLSNPVNATIGTGAGTGTITNDDAPPAIQFSASNYNVGEGAGTVTITLTKTGSTALVSNVLVTTSDGSATAPADYNALPAGYILAFAPNDTVRTFQITINEDSVYEGDEQLNVTLSAPFQATIGTQNPATVTIQDNDAAPSFSIDDVTMNEGDSDMTNFVFTVTKTGSIALSSSVNFTTQDGTATIADGDYISSSGTLTFSETDIDQDHHRARQWR